MCIHCYPDGFQYASVCHKAIAKCFIKRCKGNKIFFNDGSHVTIFALADTNTFHTPELKQFVYTLFTQNLGSKQNFQQFIGKFVVYHFYHIVLFCCIAKSIYCAIPYDVFVYDLSNGWVKTLLWIFIPSIIYTIASVVYLICHL